MDFRAGLLVRSSSSLPPCIVILISLCSEGTSVDDPSISAPFPARLISQVSRRMLDRSCVPGYRWLMETRNEESELPELQCSKEGQALFMEDELTTWLGFFPDMGDESASVPAESTMMTAAGTTVAPPPGSSGRGTVSEAAETSGMGKVTEGRGAAAAHGDDRKKLKGKEEHHHHHNDDKTQSEVEWYESGGEETKRLNKSMWRNQRQSRAAADVHNLSERRRRDRINEKMKVLQQLVPRCNKLDKASMLDDVVEYIKSLQLQLQELHFFSSLIMYRTYAMYPVVFPGIQLHAQPTEIGMPMGMDTKREFIGNPMLPFPPAIHGYPMLGQPAAHLSSSLSMQTVCPAPVSALEPGSQTSIQQDLAPSFSYTGGPYPGITLHDPNLLNCYHRYLPLHYLEQPDQN